MATPSLSMCTVCGVKTTSSTNKCLEISKSNHSSQLWTYYYHQNVQQAVDLPDFRANSNLPQQTGVPKLTFVLSVTDTTKEFPGGTNGYPFCGNCCKELEKLEKLHKDLEQIKKSVQAQVSRIAKLEQKHVNNSTKSQLAGLGGQSSLQMSFAGASVGAGNIGKTLQFLGTFCSGMLESQSQNVSKIKTSGQNTISKSGTANTNSFGTQEPLSSQHDELEDSEDSNMSSTQSQTGQQDDNECELEIGEITVKNEPLTNSEGSTSENENIPSPLTPTLPHSSKVKKPKASKAPTKRKSQSALQTQAKSAMQTCHICGKLITASNLSKHLKRHQSIKPHTCEYCDYKCSIKSDMTRHQKLKHKKKLEMNQKIKDPLAV